MHMPDVNVLVYAHRADGIDHLFFKGWLEKAVNDAQPFALSALVAIAFVRVITHPRFPGGATSLPQALAFIDALHESTACRVLAPGPRHWQLVSMLCRDAHAVGKHVADAQHAAVALEHGCLWVSRDSDFAKFVPSGLRWQHLLPAPSLDAR